MKRFKDYLTDLVGSIANKPCIEDDDDDLEDNQVVGTDGTVIDLGNNSHQVVQKVIKRK